MASRAGWPCSSRSGPCPPGVRCRVYACVRVQTQRPRARDRLHVEQGAHTRVPLCVSWLLRVLGLCRESAQVEPHSHADLQTLGWAFCSGPLQAEARGRGRAWPEGQGDPTGQGAGAGWAGAGGEEAGRGDQSTTQPLRACGPAPGVSAAVQRWRRRLEKGHAGPQGPAPPGPGCGGSGGLAARPTPQAARPVPAGPTAGQRHQRCCVPLPGCPAAAT